MDLVVNHTSEEVLGYCDVLTSLDLQHCSMPGFSNHEARSIMLSEIGTSGSRPSVTLRVGLSRPTIGPKS